MGYTHLTNREREKIRTLASNGLKSKEIAEQMNRSPATITTVLRRTRRSTLVRMAGANGRESHNQLIQASLPTILEQTETVEFYKARCKKLEEIIINLLCTKG